LTKVCSLTTSTRCSLCDLTCHEHVAEPTAPVSTASQASQEWAWVPVTPLSPRASYPSPSCLLEWRPMPSVSCDIPKGCPSESILSLVWARRWRSREGEQLPWGLGAKGRQSGWNSGVLTPRPFWAGGAGTGHILE
jgi:hypothetical protein